MEVIWICKLIKSGSDLDWQSTARYPILFAVFHFGIRCYFMLFPSSALASELRNLGKTSAESAPVLAEAQNLKEKGGVVILSSARGDVRRSGTLQVTEVLLFIDIPLLGVSQESQEMKYPS